jgi:hypothetical protein
MKKALLVAFSLITIVGGASLLAEPANAANFGCTAPKGLPADCYLAKCTCDGMWCTGTWNCDGYVIVG